jgi:hypothetical protein
MSYEEFPQQLLNILGERALQEHGLPVEQPEALMQLLIEECGLTLTEARAIVAAEAVELAEPTLRALAQTFSLSPELLSCRMRPVSSEVLLHTIVDVAGGQGDINGCDVCADLDRRVREASSSDDHEELLDLCSDLLEHTLFFQPEDELFDDEAAQEAMEAMVPVSFAEVLMQLDPPARLRVLAYAYQELSQTTDGRGASVFAACARLRGELSPLARAALDLLSQASEEEVAFKDLAPALPKGATPEAIARAISIAVAGLGEVGLALSEDPLTILTGPPVSLRLSASARSAWRALMHAERLAATI